MNKSSLAGVFVAAITPLKPDGSIDLENFVRYLDFLATRGCHGALLFGTTGEGTSFSTRQRLECFQTAKSIRQAHPNFKILLGTGTPSLDETIELTRQSFNLGVDGVVVLPPYYYRSVSDDGLFTWFSEVINKATPPDGALFGYHFPAMSGVSLSIDLLSRLLDTYPNQFWGIKDSSGSLLHARELGQRFGAELHVYTGYDNLFTFALEANAFGCITAAANLISPLLRSIWDCYPNSPTDQTIPQRLIAAREMIDRYPPAPPLIKGLLAQKFLFPYWHVLPPLVELTQDKLNLAQAELEAILGE